MKFRVWDEKRNYWDTSYQQFYPGEEMRKQGRVIQFSSGLTDFKGTEIYEGDILTDKSKYGLIVRVTIKQGAFGAQFTDQEYCKKHSIHPCFHSFYGYAAFIVRKNKVENFMVVGNIFENPELLK